MGYIIRAEAGYTHPGIIIQPRANKWPILLAYNQRSLSHQYNIYLFFALPINAMT